MRRVGLALALVVAFASSARAACSGSGLTWTCTAGSSLTNLQTAYNSGTDGMTITLAAGSYTWTSGAMDWDSTKGVTIAGAGIGLTNATIGSNTVFGMGGTITGTNTKTYDFHGISFTGTTASNVSFWFYASGAGTHTWSGLNIHHNEFLEFGTSTIAILIGCDSGCGGARLKTFGAIHHNRFAGTVNFMGLKILGTLSPDTWAASVRGTSSNIFLEDNTFDFDSATDLGSGCLDAWDSAAVVFRHNTTRNCLLTSHGTEHSGGTVNFEAYQNTLQRSGGDATWQDGTRLFHHQGSGEITLWGNVFKHSVTPISGNPMSVTHYRSADPVEAGYDNTALLRCNGSQSNDGNASGQSGWPCWMQPGRKPTGGSPVYGALSPIYNWLNTDFTSGNLVTLVIENPWSGPPFPTTHIVSGRDYYSAVSASAQSSASSPFNGTTGMGFGTLAFRPTTCTANTATNGEVGGVGYWATDSGEWDSTNGATADGELYECTASNTWTKIYTPYIYPHPFAGAGAAGPPSSNGGRARFLRRGLEAMQHLQDVLHNPSLLLKGLR